MTSNPKSVSLQPGRQIAFISAGWHADIVAQARMAFVHRLNEYGIAESSLDFVNVPGSLEIPLQCKLLAKTHRYEVIVACGLVVDGGIYRHDFVASAVLDGMMQVQLETEVPILSVVLTPHHFNEQEHHHRFFFEHFKVKGKEAAEACVQVLHNQQHLAKLKQVA